MVYLLFCLHLEVLYKNCLENYMGLAARVTCVQPLRMFIYIYIYIAIKNVKIIDCGT